MRRVHIALRYDRIPGRTGGNIDETRGGMATRRGLEAVRRLAGMLSEVEESRGRLLARLHQDGDALVVRCELEAREAVLAAHPKACFVSDHYRNDPWVLVRLASVSDRLLGELLEDAWRARAPKRVVAGFDAGA